MKSVLGIIDWVTKWSGRVASWLILVLVLTLSYEVILRYVFNAPTIWSFDTSTFLLAAIITFAIPYEILNKGHIRVDFLYRKFSQKQALMVDTVFGLLFLIPVAAVLEYFAVKGAWHAWNIGETASQSYWGPPLFPIRAAVAFGILLLLLEGVADFIKNLFQVLKEGRND